MCLCRASLPSLCLHWCRASLPSLCLHWCRASLPSLWLDQLFDCCSCTHTSNVLSPSPGGVEDHMSCCGCPPVSIWALPTSAPSPPPPSLPGGGHSHSPHYHLWLQKKNNLLTFFFPTFLPTFFYPLTLTMKVPHAWNLLWLLILVPSKYSKKQFDAGIIFFQKWFPILFRGDVTGHTEVRLRQKPHSRLYLQEPVSESLHPLKTHSD